jgi:hypothetical protein
MLSLVIFAEKFKKVDLPGPASVPRQVQHALTDEEIQISEDKLNNRHRKSLGFKTSIEYLFASFKRRTS